MRLSTSTAMIPVYALLVLVGLIANTAEAGQCQLCANGQYPTKTTVAIEMLYVGKGSCVQFYLWGRNGEIPDRHCQTLQFFARDACGCTGGNSNQAPQQNNNNNNGNNNSNNNNSNAQRKPAPSDSRPRLSGNRGGAGGPTMNRRLKGPESQVQKKKAGRRLKGGAASAEMGTEFDSEVAATEVSA